MGKRIDIQKKANDQQEELKIDLKKISGIQFDSEAKEITGDVVLELVYIKAIFSHLWEKETLKENLGEVSEDSQFGTLLIFGWIDQRLTALKNHIASVLSQGRNE